MEPLEAKVSLADFGQAFSNSLTGALALASDLSWTASISGTSAPEPEQKDSCCIFRLSGALVGNAQLFVAKSSVQELACRVTSDPGADADASDAGLKQALHELKNLFSKALMSYGEIAVDVQETSVLELVAGVTLEITLASDGRKSVSMHLVCDGALADRLQARSADHFSYPLAPERSANLDLVMDVELNIILRFGQRQLTLREVLDLNSGSVVELDRQVDEPIELVLDGRVVARGEAVIIDGNYGMRVTQVVNPVVAN